MNDPMHNHSEHDGKGCCQNHDHAHHAHDHGDKEGCCGGKGTGKCGGGKCSDLPNVDVESLPENAQILLQEMQKNQTYLQSELDETYASYVRVIAEMENVKRRAQLDSDHARKMAISSFAKDLLPVMDTLDAILQTADKLDDATREGLDLLHQMLMKSCEKNGLRRIVANGEVNPAMHQVVSTEVSDLPAHYVVREMQAGYTLYDTVLRPAMVTSSEKKA